MSPTIQDVEDLMDTVNGAYSELDQFIVDNRGDIPDEVLSELEEARTYIEWADKHMQDAVYNWEES